MFGCMKKCELLVLIAFVTIFFLACSNGTITEDDEISIKKTEISMEEAVFIAHEEADKYYDNLQVIEVHSYDNDDERSQTSGQDGKREWWYVDFGNELCNYVSILIRNGQVLHVVAEEENWNGGLIDFENVVMTSEEAAQKAKELGLRGGNPENEEEWVSGYNFKLSRSSMRETPEKIYIFMEVIGISPNGNFAHIDFDASTGEILLKEEKIIREDGSQEWKEFI